MKNIRWGHSTNYKKNNLPNNVDWSINPPQNPVLYSHTKNQSLKILWGLTLFIRKNGIPFYTHIPPHSTQKEKKRTCHL